MVHVTISCQYQTRQDLKEERQSYLIHNDERLNDCTRTMQSEENTSFYCHGRCVIKTIGSSTIKRQSKWINIRHIEAIKTSNKWIQPIGTGGGERNRNQ